MEFEVRARRILLGAGLGVLAVGIPFLFLKYLFLPLLPFLIAALISFPIAALSRKLHRWTKIGERVWNTLLPILFTAVFFLLLYLVLSRFAKELYRFVDGEKDLLEHFSSFFDGLYGFIEQKLPTLASKIDREGLTAQFGRVLSDISVKAASALAHAAFELPGTAFFAVVTLLAAYYFTADRAKVRKGLSALLPEKPRRFADRAYEAIKAGLGGYLRAGGRMMLVTFAEMLVGFCILRVEFPLILSITVAAVDFLPVLGTGAVLLPMGILFSVTGELKKGLGVFALWGVSLLVRQILEPRILGKSLGIHPLLSLFAAYTGCRLFGISGLILLPIGVSVAAGALCSAEKEIGRLSSGDADEKGRKNEKNT